MKLKLQQVLCYLVASATLFGLAQESMANDRRVHSSVCHTIYGNEGSTVYNGPYYQMFDTSGMVQVYCPMPTDSYLRHNSVQTLNVHGYEYSGTSNVSRACVKDYSSSSYTCGDYSQWGSGESGALGLDVSKWNQNGAWFPYVHTKLYAGGRLYGFWFRD